MYVEFTLSQTMEQFLAAHVNAFNFAGIEMLLALPEHQVPLLGGSRPSQNDIWVLARAGSEVVSIAVEGKVAEPFGPTLGEWLLEGSKGKSARLEHLRAELGLSENPPPTVRSLRWWRRRR